MWVHWGNKQMKFTHHGKRIYLQGVIDDISSCPAVPAQKLRGLLNRGAVSYCIQLNNVPTKDDHSDFQLLHSIQAADTSHPDQIQQLVEEFGLLNYSKNQLISHQADLLITGSPSCLVLSQLMSGLTGMLLHKR